jgi:hypothetical protein
LPERLIDRLWPKEVPTSTDVALGARAVFSRWQRGALLSAFALLVIFRLPNAWVHGRFLDEEGSVFFAYAWHHGWVDALFRPFAGYWNVGANATTLLVVKLVKGGVVSLEHAPYLTMLIALAVQLLPAILLLTGRAAWLASRVAVVAALLVVAIAPATEEVFLNVLHIQFQLALCTALILALDVPTGRTATIGTAAILFFAPLCGPAVIAFLPLFALRGWIDRDRARLCQIAALGMGAAIQLLFFYGANPMRGHMMDPRLVAVTSLTRLVVMPVLGLSSADRIGSWIDDSHADDETSGWLWMAALAVLLFGALIVAALRRRDAAIWLVLGGLGIAFASFGYGMVAIDVSDLFSVRAAERYNFLPLVLLGLALIVMAMREGSRSRWVFALLCLLFLREGAILYPDPIPEVSDGPSWPGEVAAWRRDHAHPLAVWPPPMVADLSDVTRSCTPIGRDLARSTDPRYCESGWVAGYFRHPSEDAEADELP